TGEFRATIVERSLSVREYYQNQKRIYEILGFFEFEIFKRIGEFYKRMGELTPQQSKELFELMML
ncbi:UV radiation resistance protein, partial [Helicobacter pylori]